MSKALPALLLCVPLGIPHLRADTLTLRSNEEINGQVQYENDAFTIIAGYRAGDRKVTFDRREVLTVEINSRNFNPGEPPKNISILEARSTATKDASAPAAEHKEPTPTAEPDAHGQPAHNSTQSVRDADEFDRATTDVLWLRDKTRVLGRLVRIKNGRVTVKTNGDNKQKEMEAGGIATVLVAPN